MDNAVKATRTNRRDFLRGSASALVVPFSISLATKPAFAAAAVGTGAIGAYIRIAADNTVTVILGSSEMGQGILTGLAQLVAEEMNLDWAQVRAEHAPAIGTYPNVYGNPLFGAQLTGGSTSTRGWYGPLRNAAAVARDTLIKAAHQQLGGRWALGQGGTLTQGAKSILFADVVATAATLTLPTSAPLATSTRIVGQRMPRLDIPAKVDGSAIFGMDVMVPGMQFASVLHCPVLGGKVNTMPTSRSAAMLVNLGNAVGVVAGDTWTAMQVARSLGNAVTWTLPTDLNAIDSAALDAAANTLIKSKTATSFVAELVGKPAIGPKSRHIDATYDLPFLAHATMEVMCCTASVTAEACEIWAPTQGQQFIPGLAASITGLPMDKITVHSMFMGGGLGRKFETDYVAQSISLSKAVGAPVKLIWSREQDFMNDLYRPLAKIRVRAALDATGGVSNFIYRNVSASINIQRGQTSSNNPEDTGAVSGAVGMPYAMTARKIEFVPLLPCDIPLGYWRSVGESYNTFAVESAMDELAVLAGADPMAFRKGLVAGDPRALGVLTAVETLSRWSVAPPSGTARGVAFMKGFGSYIAMVAEVGQTAAGKLRVSKMYCAIDCGIAINPGSIEAQIDGGIAHGLAATQWGQMTFVQGRPQARNFDHYPMMRLSDMPDVAVSIVASAEAPGGVGETGVPCVAPSVANAWAKLTGTRQRSLPFYPGSQMGGL